MHNSPTYMCGQRGQLLLIIYIRESTGAVKWKLLVPLSDHGSDFGRKNIELVKRFLHAIELAVLVRVTL